MKTILVDAINTFVIKDKGISNDRYVIIKR
jgi:hypothetical protein